MRLAVKETETENLLETLANKSPVGLYIVQDGRFCYTNPTFQSITGYTEDELMGRDALDFVVPEDKERVRENAIKMLKGELTLPYQFRVTHKNGSIKWVMESVVSVQYLKRRATLGDFMDITERKQVEEKVQHLNLVLQAIRNINQLIARGTDRDSLLKGACDTFVKTRGYYSAWIALLDESGKLVTAAEAGLGKSFLQLMERLKRGELTHCGCKVLEKPGVLVMKDVSSECEDCPVAKEDTGRGAMSVRLEYGGKVYGLMAVSIPPGRAAEKEEHDLLEEIAGDIAFALHSMEQEQGRKQVEEALRDSEEKLRKMFESVTDGISVINLKGIIIEVNQRMAEMHGFSSKDKLRGKSAFELVAPRDHERVAADMKKIIKQEAIRQVECTLLRADGSEFPGELSTNVLKDASGNLVGHITIVRDITERKRAEEALQAEKNKLQSLVDAMEDGLTIQNRDYNIIYQGRLQRTIFGDHLGEKCYRVYEGREKICEGCPVEKAFKDGKSHTAERRTVTSGEVTFWENTANPIRDARGEIVSCLEIGRDITERKRADETLQAEKNKLQSLIDAMEDGLTIQDRGYNIIYQNESLKKILGDHVGEKCYRAYAHKGKVCDVCPLAMAFRDGKSHRVEKEVTLPWDNVAFWEPTANPIRDAKGKIVSCLEIIRDITERKKQEQALADELTRRRLLVDKSLDGIVVLDEDAKVVEANQRFAEMLGYTLEEVCELHTWDWDKFFPPEKILEMGRNVDEKGLHLDTKHTRKDGSVIDVDISISGIMYGGQKLIFCIQRDVTERKLAEEALKNSEESYRELADSITEVFFAMDEHLRYTYWNKASEILTGVRAEDALGKSLPEVFPDTPGTRRAEKVYRAVLKAQQSQTFVNEFDMDGRHYIFEIGAYPSRGGISVFVRDITERKRAEEAIKQAAEEWRKTFDSISDAISIHDRNFKILRANEAFANIFNMKPSQIIGGHCYELHKGQKPISGCPHQQSLATGKPAVAEFYESHLGKYLLESTSPIFDKEGEVIGTIHITRDITEQKQQNERLMMADRLASIGELAAGTAHELNNPLTSVIGFSQLLMEKDISDDIREDVKLIYNEAQRAVNVTKNLLTFARKHTPVKEPNQINNIIEDVLVLHAHEHKVNHIHVEKHLAPNLPEIMVDYFQMQQVFMNIIINAEYFMIEAHNMGTLTITTKKENSKVRISIADDGPGIPPENLGRLFDPFFTTKEAGRGTGLGLSICHGIVTDHGGQIYIRSQLGKGATIFIDIPIKSLTHFKSLL